MTQFTVTVRATSVLIFPGDEAMDMLEKLLDILTYEDDFAEETKTLGYLYDQDRNILYLHKGVSIDYICRTLVTVKLINQPYHQYEEMKFEYEEIIAPRNEEQQDVINFICGQQDHSSNLDASQIFLVKSPGFGKSYCSGVGLSKYKLKTLIIMHRDSLRKQWIHSLCTMNGYTSKEVYELSDSQELYNIAHGRLKLDYDVYLMTHATFRAAVNRIGHMAALEKITANLGIGMKIIDEAHLEFKDTLLMDAVMNVKRNLYLTATNGRSSQDENAIFKHVFSNAVFYKPSKMLTDNRPKKWVDYITVAINTHCKPAIYQYRVAGSKGMNPASYGKWVIAYDKNQTHFKACAELIKGLYEEDPHAKVLVFMPLIDLCSACQEFLYQKLNHDDTFDYELDIRTIHSHNTKSENEYSKRADVIITTIASAGTGTDIPGITDIICCSPFVSKITAQQVFGRIRYIPKKCHYYDIYDTSVMLDRFWIKSRAKTLRTLALNYKNIEFVEEGKNEN